MAVQPEESTQVTQLMSISDNELHSILEKHALFKEKTSCSNPTLRGIPRVCERENYLQQTCTFQRENIVLQPHPSWYPESLRKGKLSATQIANIYTRVAPKIALINSYLCSPCWIEHLFLIKITPRSSNLVENFLFYE